MMPSILFEAVRSRSHQTISIASSKSYEYQISMQNFVHSHTHIPTIHAYAHLEARVRFPVDKRKKISGARAGNPTPCLVLLVVRWSTSLEYINHLDGDACIAVRVAFYLLTELLSVRYSHAQHEDINYRGINRGENCFKRITGTSWFSLMRVFHE